MFCEQCGAKLQDGAKFCTVCGTRVTDDIPAPAQQPQTPPAPSPAWTYQAPAGNTGYAQQPQYVPSQPQEQPKKKLGKGALIGIIAGGLVLVVILLAVFGAFGSPGHGYVSQEKLIEAYFDAAEHRDFDRIAGMLAPNEVEYISDYYNYSGSKEVCEFIDSWCPDQYSLKVDDWYIYDVDEYGDYDIEDVEDDLEIDVSEYVDVWVVVTFKNGDEYDYDFDLVKVNGKWYITEIW